MLKELAILIMVLVSLAAGGSSSKKKAALKQERMITVSYSVPCLVCIVCAYLRIVFTHLHLPHVYGSALISDFHPIWEHESNANMQEVYFKSQLRF